MLLPVIHEVCNNKNHQTEELDRATRESTPKRFIVQLHVGVSNLEEVRVPMIHSLGNQKTPNSM